MNAGNPFLGLSAVFVGLTFTMIGNCVICDTSFLGDGDFGVDSFLLSTSTWNLIHYSMNKKCDLYEKRIY